MKLRVVNVKVVTDDEGVEEPRHRSSIVRRPSLTQPSRRKHHPRVRVPAACVAAPFLGVEMRTNREKSRVR